MEHAQPRGLNRRRVEQLLSRTKAQRTAGNRIEVLSRTFLGRPYTINPLIGSAEKPEVFTTSINGFDCVTFVETVLALARASTAGEFTEWLRKIRYEGGRVQWERRNHYMTGWIRSNRKAGLLLRWTPRDAVTVTKERMLDGLPGLTPVKAHFECVPRPGIRRIEPQLETGDLIFFASTRKHLDVFHCGIIVRDGSRILMRHASRSKGGVVEQELNDFLKANRMAGIIVARPR